ncbi:MAG: hypothetical protein HOC20_03650 [Chloroflexi bacterium]|jgi:hypothetical protein|nr:hypothetical protein [Chloroflexota bacterium]
MKKHMLVLLLIVCIVASTLIPVDSVSAEDEYLDCPSKLGDISLDWRPENSGHITVTEEGIHQAVCTYVVSYDNFNNPELFVSLLVQWCEVLPCDNLRIPSGHWSNAVWSEDKWAFVAEEIKWETVPKIANAAAQIQKLKASLLEQAQRRAIPRSASAPNKIKSITLEHFHPFLYARPGSFEVAPAGDLVATVKDQDGNPMKGEVVVFFVDKETPSTTVPGKNLYEVLSPVPNLENKPPGEIDGEPLERKYLGWTYTDSSGKATFNYLQHPSIDILKFSEELKGQRTVIWGLDEEGGKISGTIIAGVLDPETKYITPQTRVDVEFEALAKILRIYGEGREDGWNNTDIEGTARVKRDETNPKFPWRVVEDGFLLMPGDVINIDGGAGLEIFWINGDQAIMNIRSTIVTGEPGHQVTSDIRNAYLTIAPNATRSKFPTAVATAIEAAAPAFVKWIVGKGVDLVAFAVPKVAVLKPVVQYIAVSKTADPLSQIEFRDMIRIRSLLRIDNTGEGFKVYTFEGSPDVMTEKGEEATLSEGEMVEVAEDGTIGPVSSFDAEAALKEFWDEIETMPAAEDSDPDGTPSPTDTTLGGTAGLVGESRTVIPGGTVSVPVRMGNVEDIGSLNFDVTYDSSVINIDRVDKGSLLSGISFVANPNETGIIRFGFATVNGVSGTGPIGYIVCDAVGSAGSKTHLTISGVEATDSSGNPITLQTVNGSVTIDSDRIVGDSNGDGVLTELDALAALRMSVNLLAEDLILDIDKNGKVTAEDARRILSIAVRGR